MNGSSDRLKVIRIKGIGIDQPIPSDDIKRVTGQSILRPAMTILDENIDR